MNEQSKKYIKVLFGILLGCFLVFVVLPGLIIKLSKNGFDRKEIEQNISKTNIVKSRLDTVLIGYLNEIHEIDSLKQVDPKNQRLGILELKHKEIKLSILSFNNSPTMFLWWTTFSVLFFLFYLIGGLPKDIVKSFFAIESWLIFILFYSPFLLRNLILDNYLSGRRVWAYNNVDIDLVSHLFQAFTMMLFAILVTTLMTLFRNQYENKVKEGNDIPLKEGEEEEITNFLFFAKTIIENYQKWMIHSFILAMGFIYWTILYWDFVGKKGDIRYVMSAVTIHIIWAAIWFFASLNLIENLNRYSKAKFELIEKFVNNPAKYEKINEILITDNPVNRATLTLTLLGTILTLLSPLFKMILG